MIRRMATMMCVCLLTAAPAWAQVKLEHKISEGKKLTTQTFVSIDQTLTIAGNGTETKVENQTTLESDAGKRGTDGKIPVKQKIKALQISIEGTGGDYRFDSANPDDKGSSQMEFMRDVHKAMMDRELTIIHGKKNRVVEIKQDDILSKLPERVQTLVKSEFDPKNIKEAANQILDMLPKKPVKKGDSWERTTKANFGAGQMMKFKSKYTYEGTIEKDGRKLDKINTVASSVEFAMADDSPLPIKLKDSQLKIKESKGHVLFDREKGHTVEMKETIRIAGDLTFTAGGQTLPSELDLKMESEIVVK